MSAVESEAGRFDREPLHRRAMDRGLDVVPAAPTLPDAVTNLPEVAHRDSIFRRSLAVADAVATVAAVQGALALTGAASRPTALLTIGVVVLLAKSLGLYDREELVMRKSTLEELPQLLELATIFLMLSWFGQEVLSGEAMTRKLGVLLWGLLVAGTVIARTAARAWARGVAPAERLLLVGDAAQHQRLIAKLEQDPRTRAHMVAHLPIAERRTLKADQAPWEALDWAVRRYCVHRVVIAPGAAESDEIVDVISRAKALGVNVTVMPRIAEVVGSSVTFDQLGGIPMLGVRRFGLSRSSQLLKRAVDLAGAGAALVLVGPLMGLIALLIRLDTSGPALYRQTRVGKGGRPFTLLKFRSMVDGADAQRAALRIEADTGGLFKLAADPRVTRVGRFLRATSLDELPQLYNVLRGEMSLVGPRPLIVEEDQRVAGWHRRRLHLTPGMTGPWQVMGSASVRVPLREMVTIDYLYVANWSLWVDLKILARTVAHVAGRRGV